MFTSFHNERQQITTPTAIAVDKNTVLDQVVQCNQALNDKDTLNSISPQTRETYVASLTKRRRRLVTEMIHLEEEKEAAICPLVDVLVHRHTYDT